jgi:hypothetical protein
MLRSSTEPRRVICTPIKFEVKSAKKRLEGQPCSRTDYNEQKERNDPMKEDVLTFDKTSDGWKLTEEASNHIPKVPMVWCWDDREENKAKIGDVFIFWDYNGVGKGGKGNPWGGGDFIFHLVEAVRPPSERLPSWHNNVGQGTRNVLELSPPKFKLTYEEMIGYGVRPQYHGTSYPKSGVEPGSDLMLLIEKKCGL